MKRGRLYALTVRSDSPPSMYFRDHGLTCGDLFLLLEVSLRSSDFYAVTVLTSRGVENFSIAPCELAEVKL